MNAALFFSVNSKRPVGGECGTGLVENTGRRDGGPGKASFLLAMRTHLQKQQHAISPRWFTLEGASTYSGLTIRTLQNYIAAGHVRSATVVAAGKSRGRRLVDRASLDAFIEQGLTRPPSEIVMNRGRKTKRSAEAVAGSAAR
jgi:hypothetical protein